MATDHLDYPRGRIAMDSGDLMDVSDVTYDRTNNATTVHTLRRGQAGTTLGKEETTVSFNVMVSANGLERDYLSMVKTGTVKQVRLKVIDATITVEGRYKDVGFDLPIDAPINQRLTFIGKTTD